MSENDGFAVAARLNELQPFIQLGNDITQKLKNKDSILNYLITRAQDEANSGLLALAEADLTTEEGLKIARAAQAAIKRYDDMNLWLTEAVIHADECEKELVGIFGDELPEIIADWNKTDEHQDTA